MPSSRNIFKSEVKFFLNEYFSQNNITKILDVGPGEGTYSKLLPNHNLDAVEVFERYVSDYNLRDLYNEVFVDNIINFDYSGYQFIILGDILEHLSIEDGIKLITSMDEQGIKCLVAVPFMQPQGVWGGNTYEIHLQPDLNPTTINDRYPTLNVLFTDQPNYVGGGGYGYYINFIK